MCPYQPRQYPDTLYPQSKQEPRARSSSCVSSNLGRIQEPGALRVFFVAKAGSRRSQELLIYPQYPRQDQGARSSTCVPFSQAGSRSQELLICPQQPGTRIQELLICPHSGLGRIPTGKINEPPSLLRFTNTFIMSQKERDLQVSQN